MKSLMKVFGYATMLSVMILMTGVHARGSDQPYPADEITIDGKKPAKFKHSTHIELGLDCAKCHHDQEHAPLSSEQIAAMADTKQLQCVSCHNENFSQNAKLQKRKDVFHARCRECHKAGYNDKKGPTKCNDCHIKGKRKKLEGC